MKWRLRFYSLRGHVWFDVKVSSLWVAHSIIDAFRSSNVHIPEEKRPLYSWSASRIA